ncbi:hypothetical protein TSOC_007056, partial [Tetrabaena socialis]
GDTGRGQPRPLNPAVASEPALSGSDGEQGRVHTRLARFKHKLRDPFCNLHHKAKQALSSASAPISWTALRLCSLHGVWCVHKDLDPARHHSHAVVTHVVVALRRLLWAQFRMTALSDDLLDPLPTAILIAQLKVSKLAEFKAAWAHRRVLCEVVEPAAGGAQLRVLVSLSGPVVAPAAPAAAGEEG